MRRCAPMVVPVLPPTGTAGVVSLNPSPGPSMLTMLMVAAACSIPGIPIRSASNPSLSNLTNIERLLCRHRMDFRLGILFARDAFHLQFAIGTYNRDGVRHLVFTQQNA